MNMQGETNEYVWSNNRPRKEQPIQGSKSKYELLKSNFAAHRTTMTPPNKAQEQETLKKNVRSKSLPGSLRSSLRELITNITTSTGSIPHLPALGQSLSSYIRLVL